MTLFYKGRQNTIASEDGEKKWHPVLVKVGRPVSLVDMADEVAEKSSLTPGDVLSAARNLMQVMSRHLKNSQSVRLDGLGTFTLIATSRGKGVSKEEDVTAGQITNLRVRFTPEFTRSNSEGVTRAMLSKITYAIWGGKTTTASGGNESGNSGNEGDGDYTDPDA